MKRNRKLLVLNTRHIVVHSTGTRQDMQVRELDKLAYHFLITKSGRLINIRPLSHSNGKIEVAWLGGLDKRGRHVDNRTEEQKETLFNTLVVLSEQFPLASIVGADELYVYGFANPGFDIKIWLKSYLPPFLQAA